MSKRIVLLLAVAGCASEPSGALAVYDPRQGSGTYDVHQTPSLFLEATYRAGPGEHHQRIEVIAPDSTIYSVVEGDELAAADGTVHNFGHVHVAGTPIEEFTKVGRWTFRLLVDGAAVSEKTAMLVSP